MKYAVTADVQLDEHARMSHLLPNGRTSRLQDMVNCMNWLVDMAIVKKCTGLIVIGDIFHNRSSIDLSVLDAACRVFHHASKHLKIDMIVGNHDSALRSPEINSLQVFKGYATIWDCYGTRGKLGFVPWTENLEELEKGIDSVSTAGAQFLFTHGLLKEAVNNAATPLTLEMLKPQKFKRILLGDVHEPKVIKLEGTPCPVRYVGSPLQINFSDAGGDRGFLIFDDQTNEIEFVENKISPRFHTVTTAKEVEAVQNGDKVRVRGDNYGDAEEATEAAKKVTDFVESDVVVIEAQAPRLDVKISDSNAEIVRRFCEYKGLSESTELIEVGARILSSIDTGSMAKKESTEASFPYKFGKTTYLNFGPFEDVTFDFSLPGLTVVDGVIDNFRGANSNGAGKSMILDGLSWCVYGRVLRDKLTPDDCIRNGSKGGMSVVTEIIGGPEIIKIVRHRKHPQFKNTVRLYIGNEEAEVSKGTSGQTDLAIEQLLGMDFVAFTNGVAYAARHDVKSFYGSTDAEKKKVFERMLGIEIYLEAEKSAKATVKDFGKMLATCYTTRDRLQGSAQEKETALQRLSETDWETRDSELARLRQRLQLLQQFIETKTREIDEIEASEAEQLEEQRALFEAYEQERLGFLRTKSKLEADRRGYDVRIGTLRGELNSLNSQKTTAASLDGKRCPTCKQVVKADKAAVVKVDFDTEIEERQTAINECESERKVVEDQLAKHAETEPQAPVVPAVGQGSALLKADRRARESDVRGAQSTIDALVREKQAFETNKERYEAEVKDLNDKLRAELEKITKQEHDRDLYQFWVEGFGNSGIKSFVIEAEAAGISLHATRYAQRLLCEGTTVIVNATRQLKTLDETREEMSINVSIPGCTETYGGCSRGQRNRLDLALLLAFRDVLARRKTRAFDQVFADELFDGLDRTGIEYITELLLEESAVRPVVLVTHDDRLKQIGSRTVTVKHNGKGIAKLLAIGVKCATVPFVKATGKKLLPTRGAK